MRRNARAARTWLSSTTSAPVKLLCLAYVSGFDLLLSEEKVTTPSSQSPENKQGTRAKLSKAFRLFIASTRGGDATVTGGGRIVLIPSTATALLSLMHCEKCEIYSPQSVANF
ncbi:hypothetical protein BKA80DRAFT_13268 [Phyllosticta citrichinensis]